jgi:hypothetical protein
MIDGASGMQLSQLLLSAKPEQKHAALQRARDCYTRFGMTAQAARVAEAMEHV